MPPQQDVLDPYPMLLAAYLHHLFRCEELLAYRLATIHNLHFMNTLMNKIRDAILSGSFPAFRDRFIANYRPTDEKLRLAQKQKWLDAWNNRRTDED